MAAMSTTSRPSPRHHRPLRAAAAAGLTALALASCGSATTQTPRVAAPASSTAAASAVLDRLGVDGSDVTRAIEALDQQTGERNREVLASVRYDTLVLKDATTETSVPIPGDRFYLSVAPYVNQTHECYYHSLTTCRGELADADLDVTITDADGAVLVDGPTRTYANGFVGFWLPRDLTGTITITHDGRTATAPISTGVDAPTCLTTVQLA